ncbi:hypothetical protein ABZS66_56365 [Dactylosporangium sp. NPDC005572]
MSWLHHRIHEVESDVDGGLVDYRPGVGVPVAGGLGMRPDDADSMTRRN